MEFSGPGFTDSAWMRGWSYKRGLQHGIHPFPQMVGVPVSV
jgi:hypothetical protein